jgi:hypothetical protein
MLLYVAKILNTNQWCYYLALMRWAVRTGSDELGQFRHFFDISTVGNLKVYLID